MGYPRNRSKIINIRQCPECHGEGVVYASYDAFMDDRHYIVMGACPICEGRGTVPAKQNDNNKENYETQTI